MLLLPAHLMVFENLFCFVLFFFIWAHQSTVIQSTTTPCFPNNHSSTAIIRWSLILMECSPLDKWSQISITELKSADFLISCQEKRFYLFIYGS